MKKKRRSYTEEFKKEAVSLITEQGYNICEAARNLGIGDSMLGKWKRELENGSSNHDTDELKRLKKENKQLRMEREILKKAAAFFAKESNTDICL